MTTGNLQHKKRIQLRLVYLIHAKKCQDRELKSGSEGGCTWSCCKVMKRVLNHMSICSAGYNCSEIYCYSSKKIIIHWTNCQNIVCDVCMPLKEAERSYNIKTPQPNDEHLHEELQQLLDLGQLDLGLDLESVTPPVNSAENLLNKNNDQLLQTQTSTEYPMTAAIAIHSTKQWQISVSFQKRAQNVNMIIQALMVPFDVPTLCNGKFNELSNYGKDIEREYYQFSSNANEYNCLVQKTVSEIYRKNGTY